MTNPRKSKGQNAAPPLWTLDDAAKYLKISRVTMYRYITAGTIKAYKMGGGWRFDPDEVQQWAKEQPNVVRPVGTHTTLSDRHRALPTADDTAGALDAIVRRTRQARNGA